MRHLINIIDVGPWLSLRPPTSSTFSPRSIEFVEKKETDLSLSFPYSFFYKTTKKSFEMKIRN